MAKTTQPAKGPGSTEDPGSAKDAGDQSKGTTGATGTKESSLSGEPRRSSDPLPFPAEPTAQEVRDADAALQADDDARREKHKDEEREALRQRDLASEDRARDVKHPSDFLKTEGTVLDHPDARPAEESVELPQRDEHKDKV
jgi:hypothetical protein